MQVPTTRHPASRVPRRRPLALSIVAWLFILSGVATGLEVLLDLLRSRLNLNFGVINFFIGLGLLRYRRGWRTLALVVLWIAMIGCVVVFGIGLGSAAGETSFKLLGIKVSDLSRGVFLLYVGGFFLFTVWQYRVLIRPDIRRLFIPEPPRC